MEFAHEEIFNLSDRQSNRKYFSELRACRPTNTMTVFRVRGNQAYDAALRRIGKSNHVRIILVDTKYSKKTLEHVSSIVWGRSAEFTAHGAKLVSTVVRGEGYLDVGVQGDFKGARAVVADLGDKVRIAKGIVVVMT